MTFEEQLPSFIERCRTIRENISGEESTKTSLIMPFFQILGYDVFNPTEFIPEFTADVGIKKGEKVDYAICINGAVTLLIEAKAIDQSLQKHDSQLFRYFGTTNAKFAILTNGINYNFYTDLDDPNKMDSTPFLSVDLLNLSDNDVVQLKKFQKENFDINTIFSAAADLKYMGLIKKVLCEEFANPTDEFVKHILNAGVYDGVKTQSVVDKYRPLIKKAVAHYINELVSDKIQSALTHSEAEKLENEPILEVPRKEAEIITTEDELQAYYIIKSILVGSVPLDRISYKDTRSYFSILIDNKVTKWICRIYLKENVKFIVVNENGENVRYDIEAPEDIYNLSEHIVQSAKQFL